MFGKCPENLWLSPLKINCLVYLFKRDAGNRDQKVQLANGLPASTEKTLNSNNNTLN